MASFRYLTSSALFVLLSLVLAAGPTEVTAQPAALVEVDRVTKAPSSQKPVFVGTVVPARRSIIGSAVDGRVEKLHFDVGDFVIMQEVPDSPGLVIGQPLVQLRTRTIGFDVTIAEAELKAIQHQLSRLEKTLPARIDQAKGKRTSAEASWKYSQTRHARVQKLFQQGNVTPLEEFEQATNALIVAQQNHLIANSEYVELQETYQIRLDQTRAAMSVKQDELGKLQDIEKKYTIRTPFAGFVTRKVTEAGAWVRQGDVVAEVIELDPVEIEVFVPEQKILAVVIGMNVKVHVAGGDGTPIPGKVDRIVPQADPQSRAFPVRIRLANPDFQLKAGMLARVEISINSPQAVLQVHKDALVLNGLRKTVAVAVRDPKSDGFLATIIPVQLGPASGPLIEIRGNVKAGDFVVVRGNERLRPNQPIRFTPPSISNSAGTPETPRQ